MTPPVTPEAGRWPDADRVAPAVFAWADVISTGDAVGPAAPSAGGADATTPAAGPGGDSPDPVSGDGPDSPPSERPRLETLRKRADFLRAARAGRARVDAFTLQARRRDPQELSKSAPAERAADEAPGGLIRVGYTCSKKVGNAVARNRAKRRLREAARKVLPVLGRPGWDYVLIGRRDETAALPFERLVEELERALQRAHRAGPSTPGARGPRRGAGGRK